MSGSESSNVVLAPYTTLKVGGPADRLIEVRSIADLRAAARLSKIHELPLFVLGGGSNVLIADAGFQGLVLRMMMTGVDHRPAAPGRLSLTVGAGESFDEVVALSVQNGWWGLENLSYIPGTAGATPVQNVGAYGVEVADLITAVAVFDLQTGRERILSRTDCRFGYRDSIFKTAAFSHVVITAVTFELSLTPAPKLGYADLARTFAGTDRPDQSAIREAVIRIRQQKFPDWSVLGTAGSFFKNPIITGSVAAALKAEYPDLPVYPTKDPDRSKISLGYVLDKICGLKGYQSGRVSLFKEQALVLVAEPGATAAEIDEFAAMISKKVFEKIKIKIEREVTELR